MTRAKEGLVFQAVDAATCFMRERTIISSDVSIRPGTEAALNSFFAASDGQMRFLEWRVDEART